MDRPASISLVIALPKGMPRRAGDVEAFQSQLDPTRGDEARIEAATDGAILVPQLWARGLEQAHGQIVAFTLASMRPEPGWADAIRTAIHEGVTGVGGAIEPGVAFSVLDWAVHLCRYSSYLLAFPRGEVEVLPGDNSAYRRDALQEQRSLWIEGFWETEVDAALRTRGARLELDPAIVVRHGRSAGFVDFCRNRFRHGIRSGRTRARSLSLPSRALRVLAFPLVPCVLLLRIARRALPRGYGWPLCRSIPLLLVFLTVWAAGEAVGYGRGPRHRRDSE